MLVSTAARISGFVFRLMLIVALFPGTSFGVDLFFEDFEGVTLGPTVTHGVLQRDREAWSATPPPGWVTDNSGMPPGVLSDPNNGVTEFEGWTIVDKNWWVPAAGFQGRENFINGLGKIAVADNDTHDDFGDPDAAGPFDSKLSTPSIALGGAAPNTVNVSFNSSWLPEEIQKATLTARFNNGANVEVLRWHSSAGDPLFHADAPNESVTLPLQNPAGATSVVLEFRLFDATNNWWWGIDNISVFTGAGASSDSVLRAVIDRGSSNVSIVNNTGEAVSLRGYSVRSAAGAFNEPNAAFQADSVANWVQLTAPNATGDLSEGHLSSSNFASGGTMNLGNNVWRKYFQDASDVTFQYLIAGNDEPIQGIVEFTGNGGASFPFLDLNFSGSVEAGDWDAFRANFTASLAGLSRVQRYQLGDLDNDGLHTANDFLEFRRQFNAVVGDGAFEAMLAAGEVPEPATAALLFLSAAIIAGVCLRRQRRGCANALPAAAITLVVVLSATTADAQLTLFTEDFEGLALGPNVEEALAGSEVWTKTPPPGWMIDDSGIPGVMEPPENNGVIEWAGWSFADKNWWAATAGGQERELFARGTGTVMIADPDEWDDQAHPDADDMGSTAACADVNPCVYDAFISTPTITIPSGIPAGRIKLAFDSSWRDEGNDDSPFLVNNQRATVKASYNGGAPLSVLTWDSVPETSPNFHNDAPNEAVEVDLQYDGTATNVRLTFGLDLAENDWWWAVDNIRVFVPADPSILRVNTTTGQVSIVGGDVVPASINYIDITSANGALNGAALAGLSTTRPDSVDGPDADATIGNSSGEFWQMLSATNNRVTEAFLHGHSDFTETRTEFLGSIFNTSTPVANRDIVFTYTNIFNDVVTGVVEYFESPGIPGDYNGNGRVDAADYTVWRDNLGSATSMLNDATPGVDATDYTLWKTNFGMTAGSGSAAGAAVPEPTSGLLAIVAMTLAALGSIRRAPLAVCLWNGGPRSALVRRRLVFIVSACIASLYALSASAIVPPPPVLDRNYRMGDDPAEGAVNGGTVTTTFDSAGLPGMQQLIDLSAVNGPKYEALPTTTGGPVPRRPDNGTGLAIRLNPTSASQGQHLKTGFERALNFPERSFSSTFTPGGTIDYSFIEDRGFQLWVLPQTAARADIVLDTNQHGALINSSGRFAMRYVNADYDTGVSVTPNTWYHLAVVRPFGPSRGSIMYVNGNAVAAATGSYAGEENPALEETTPLVIGANTSNIAFQVGALNRFQGLVDDLEMFVMGLNDTADYGEFIFERDNDYAAFFKPANPADLTNDNIVNMADVDVFVDNWLSQNTLTWIQENQTRSLVVGDLTSRMKGDFNFDGFVNLADWDILNDLAPPGVGAAALALISGTIPEPTGFALAAIGIVWGLAAHRVRTPKRSAAPSQRRCAIEHL